jgi:hypothetical protein
MLKFKSTPEPLTYAARDSVPSFARPEAYQVLLAEIRRYGAREISGRSLLISGSRGAGKTTMVRLAIDEAQRDGLPARPILVGLHGPDLLGHADPLPPKHPAAEVRTKDPDSTAPSSSVRDSTKKRNKARDLPKASMNPVAQAALELITKALYRAYVDELCSSYAEAVAQLFPNHPKRRLFSEMAASLQASFDWAPGLEVLRPYWEKAGLLDIGVLARIPYSSTRALELPGQGMRELVAAAAARDAFRLVVGKLERGQASDQSATSTEKTTGGLDGKGLFPSLLGLLSGGLVGGAMVTAHSGPVAAALSAVGTALATSFTLTYSLTLDRGDSRTAREGFTWDTSLGSLDRMLPSVLERILDAGLAPVFVVDELDKVSSLETRMEDLVRHLKHIVTERAFFCFLTNRDYFEYVENAGRKGAYGKEHTFFTHRLFITFGPEELRNYVAGRLDFAPPPNPEDTTDKLLLPYVLTQWARLHPIDLQRGLGMITNAKGEVVLRPGEVRQPGFRHAAVYQVIVEYLLQESKLRNRVRQEPGFRRLAYDTLYFPAWNWCVDGDRHLRIGKADLATFLNQRAGGEKPLFPSEPAALAMHRDLGLLHGEMLRLVHFLAHPPEFRALLQAENAKPPSEVAFRVEPQLVEAVPSADDKPLMRATQEDGVFEWVFDGYGQLLEEPTPPSQVKLAPAMAAEEDPRIIAITELDSTIKALTANQCALGKLATDYYLLESTPAWTEVSAAIERRRQKTPPSPSQAASDEDTISRYHAMLMRSNELLRGAFLLAGVLGQDLNRGLDIVTKYLGFSRRTPDQRGLKLREALGTLPALASEGTVDAVSEALSFAAPTGFPIEREAWAAHIDGLRHSIKPPPDAVRDRWNSWAQQLALAVGLKGWLYEASPSDLFAEVAQPSKFQADTANLQPGQWGRLLSLAAKEKENAALVGLVIHLGFVPLPLSLASQFPALGPIPVPSFPPILPASLLLLDDAQLTPTMSWTLYPTTGQIALPILHSEWAKFGAALGLTPAEVISELGIARVFVEKAAVSSEEGIRQSLAASWGNQPTHIPIFLITDRGLGLEIRANSLDEAVQKANSSSVTRSLGDWLNSTATAKPP